MGDGAPPSDSATTRLVVAPEDLERITTSIRAGVTKEPADPAELKKAAVWSWVAPLVGLGLLLLLYIGLTHWRPPVDPSVKANALPATEVLTHQPETHDVWWQVSNGQVHGLSVEGSQAVPLTIVLPIVESECGEIAASLGATCSGRTIHVQAPVTVAWSTPQVLTLGSPAPAEYMASQLTLTLQQPSNQQIVERGGASEAGSGMADTAAATPALPQPPQLPQLTFAASDAEHQEWCFVYQRSAASTLSVSGGSGGYQRQFDPDVDATIDCSGVLLRVRPAGSMLLPDPGEPSGTSSIVTLTGVSSIDVDASSRQLHLSALTGNLTLESGMNQLLDAQSGAVFRARGSINSLLKIQAGTPSLDIRGEGVTSIVIDTGNLVTTVWQRHNDLALPIFLALVGLMTPLLGAAYRNTIDYLVLRVRPALLRRALRWIWRSLVAVALWITWPVRWLLSRLRPRSPRQAG